MSSPILTADRPLTAKAKFARLWQSHGRQTAGAMTATGSGALASGLLSALASKILAAQGGPAAIAMLATLQQARQGALIAATMNGQTAVIQGASARGGEDRREYLRTSAVLFSAGTALVAAACILCPSLLRGISGLAPLSNEAFRWLAVCIALSSASDFPHVDLERDGQNRHAGHPADCRVVVAGRRHRRGVTFVHYRGNGFHLGPISFVARRCSSGPRRRCRMVTRKLMVKLA